MATLVAKTVDVDGTADYASLNAAEAANFGATSADLVANDEYVELECAPSATADTTTVTINGFTTDATRDITIQSTGSNRHQGYLDTSLYRFSATSGLGSIYVQSSYVRIIGLQFAPPAAYTVAVSTGANSVLLWVEQCIFQTTADAVAPTNYVAVKAGNYQCKVYVSNCIVSGWRGGGAHTCAIYLREGSLYAYNNTIYNCKQGIYKEKDASADIYVKNNLIKNCTLECYDYDGTDGFEVADYNGSDDSTAPGTNTVDTSNVVLAFPELGHGNTGSRVACYLLDAHFDTTAIGAATDLSADSYYAISTDILGTTRSRWDLGAHEAPTVTTIVVDVDAGGGHDYTNLDTAMTTEAIDLPTNKKCIEFVCKNTSGSSDANNIIYDVADGWTTDYAHYVRIRADASYRHAGVYDSSKYHIAQTANGIALRLDSGPTADEPKNYGTRVRVEGIQIKHSYTYNGYEACISLQNSRGIVELVDCIFWMSTTSGITGSNNCVIYGSYLYQYFIVQKCLMIIDGAIQGTNTAQSYLARSVYQNCTIVGPGAITADGLISEADSFAYNTIVDLPNAVGNCFGALVDGDYNCSADTSAPGASSVKSHTPTYIDAASDDYRLSTSDTSLYGAGTDLSDYSATNSHPFTTDIDGDTITQWSIGADDGTGGGGPAAPDVIRAAFGYGKYVYTP